MTSTFRDERRPGRRSGRRPGRRSDRPQTQPYDRPHDPSYDASHDQYDDERLPPARFAYDRQTWKEILHLLANLPMGLIGFVYVAVLVFTGATSRSP